MAKHTIREEMKWVVLFVGAIWVVFLLNCLPLPINLNDYGLRPRTLWGLEGIFTAPFLHRDIWHLVSNTVPLFVLLSLLAGSRAASHWVVISLVTLGGLLLWVGGQPAIHIGASGLVFGLIAYLISAGFFERRPLSILISVVVGGAVRNDVVLWRIAATTKRNLVGRASVRCPCRNRRLVRFGSPTTGEFYSRHSLGSQAERGDVVDLIGNQDLNRRTESHSREACARRRLKNVCANVY